MDAQIDLTPHQIDATSFAFKNSLNKGVLLADDVGLGKTIEAGLVIVQKWGSENAEYGVIVPANLRKQWHQELPQLVEQEVLEKLLNFPAFRVEASSETPAPALAEELQHRKAAILTEAGQRNLKYFEAEVDKPDAWADDLKVGLEQEIKNIDRDIREVRRNAKSAVDLNGKLDWQKRQRDLEKLPTRKRRELFDRQDEVDGRREALIAELEDKLEQKVEEIQLFSICWQVV